jgi:hypothetical protein
MLFGKSRGTEEGPYDGDRCFSFGNRKKQQQVKDRKHHLKRDLDSKRVK